MTSYVIDPGHGPIPGRGKSSQGGVRGPVLGARESDVTWRIASQLARHLGGAGMLTRDERDNPSLGERAGTARRVGASAFLSLHANGGRPGRRGSEAYVHPRAGAASLALAREIQQELSRLGHPSHGVARGELAVLTPEALGGDVPACLVELDYLGDAEGERRLTDPRQIDAIAQALARALTARGRYGYQRAPSARGLDDIPAPTFDPNDPVGWLRSMWEWTARYAMFTVGITDGSVFPHSAIARVDVGATFGSGFYISPSRILTAAHVVEGAASVRVRAGYTRGASSNDVVILDSRFIHIHPSRVVGVDDFDFAVIEIPSGTPDGRFFAIEEQRASPISGVVTCGYAQDEQDPEIQHCDTGSIVEVLPETYTFDIQTRHGMSGGPVFYLDSGLTPIATGVNVASWRAGGTPLADQNVNIGCRLTDAKVGWIWSFGWSLYFAYDSAALGGDVNTQSTLDHIVAHLNLNSGMQVVIEGYASQEGDAPYNERLSRERADAVAARLRSAGLGARIASTTGLGEAFGAAHSAPEFDEDRRVVVRPL